MKRTLQMLVVALAIGTWSTSVALAACGDGIVDNNESCDPACASTNPSSPSYCAPDDRNGYCNGDPALGQCTTTADCGLVPDGTRTYDCIPCHTVCGAGGARQSYCDGNPANASCTNSNQCPGSQKCFYAYTCCFQNCQTPGTVVSCSDGNDCTTGDQCSNNVCTGAAVASGTPCNSQANTDCTNPDTCNASGVCQDNDEPAGFGCTDTVSDCFDAQCNGSGTCNQSQGFEVNGTPCGSGVDTDCSNPDTCNGSGTCLQNNEANGTQCTDTVADCMDARCNGSGTCNQTAGFELAGFACGNGLDDGCTNPDTCNGSGTCLDNHEANGFPCGSPSNTDCTNPDTCNGTGTCLANDEVGGTQCTDTVADCLDAQCNGTGTCDQSFGFEASGFACPDTTGDCLDARCNGTGTCDQSFTVEAAGFACGSPSDTDCTNPDTCNASGTCLPNHEVDGIVCTDTTADCLDARCDGGGACDQARANEALGFACGDASDTECSNPDSCDGAGSCSGNHEAGGTGCTDTVADCKDAQCDGGGACDQAFGNEAAGFACADTTADCLDSACDGSGACDQTFGVEPLGFACGDASDTECSNPDSCDGAGACDGNHEADGVTCTDTTADCLDARCDGSGGCDQARANEAVGFACGDPTDTECSNPDSCDGAGGCNGNHEAAGFACTDTAPPGANGDCGVAGCDGAGLCDQAQAEEAAGTACGDQTDDACTNPDICVAGAICDANDEARFVGPCRFVVMGEFTYNRLSRGTKFVDSGSSSISGDICTQRARLSQGSLYDGNFTVIATPANAVRYGIKVGSNVGISGNVSTESLAIRGSGLDGAFSSGENRVAVGSSLPLPGGGTLDTTGTASEIGLCKAVQTDVTDMATAIDAEFDTLGADQDLGKFFVRSNQVVTLTASKPGQTNRIDARKFAVLKNGTLRLDAAGDPDTVFLIRSNSRLLVGRNARVELVNGADPGNVLFYARQGQVLIGRDAEGAGGILAPGIVHVKRDVNWNGMFATRRGIAIGRQTVIEHAPFVGVK